MRKAVKGYFVVHKYVKFYRCSFCPLNCPFIKLFWKKNKRLLYGKVHWLQTVLIIRKWFLFFEDKISQIWFFKIENDRCKSKQIFFYIFKLNTGKACKVASCYQKKSMNHVFEVPKHSINKNKWNFFNGIFKFKKFRKYFEFKKK